MDKVIIALVMFLFAMILKEKIEKKAGEKLEKELKKATSFSRPPAQMAKELEKAVANSVPNIYLRRKADIQAGLLKISNAAGSNKLAHIRTDIDKRRFFS